MTTRRLVAPILAALAGALVVVGSVAPAWGGAEVRSGETPAVCRRLEARLAEVPGMRDRIRNQVRTLEERIAEVGDPRRRARVAARLASRLANLRTLDERLTAQVVDAESRCAGST